MCGQVTLLTAALRYRKVGAPKIQTSVNTRSAVHAVQLLSRQQRQHPHIIGRELSGPNDAPRPECCWRVANVYALQRHISGLMRRADICMRCMLIRSGLWLTPGLPGTRRCRDR
eukprot:6685844-Pyramimonas_sp.AAC.1